MFLISLLYVVGLGAAAYFLGLTVQQYIILQAVIFIGTMIYADVYHNYALEKLDANNKKRIPVQGGYRTEGYIKKGGHNPYPPTTKRPAPPSGQSPL